MKCLRFSILFLITFLILAKTYGQDAREKNHSMNVTPIQIEGLQKYYVTWSSSSGSDDGWQHDIYNQIISFTSVGEIVFDSEPIRFIGTGNDEAQEPVNVAINPVDNTMLSVWEDGSGSTVDIRGQMHTPDGMIIKSNWVISGGEESQHSPDVVHLDGMFLVSLTDEAVPAQTSMNEIRILDDQTGEQIDSFNLSPEDEDHWWSIINSNEIDKAFVGWGNGAEFYGSVIKINDGVVTKTDQKFYISGIDQYYYSVSWLEELSKFIVVAKVNNNSVACLVDTNGVRTNIVSLTNAPIAREVELAVRWDNIEQGYSLVYPSGLNNLAIISVTSNGIELSEIIEEVLLDSNWPTTGIACQFVYTTDGRDLWEINKKVLFIYNDENSNDAIYKLFDLDNSTDIFTTKNGILPNKVILNPAFPNPFNPTTRIRFSIPNQNYVQLDIFNIQGELITKLFKKNLISGNYEVEWNGENTSGGKVVSGIYVVRLTIGSQVFSNKVLLAK